MAPQSPSPRSGSFLPSFRLRPQWTARNGGPIAQTPVNTRAEHGRQEDHDHDAELNGQQEDGDEESDMGDEGLDGEENEEEGEEVEGEEEDEEGAIEEAIPNNVEERRVWVIYWIPIMFGANRRDAARNSPAGPATAEAVAAPDTRRRRSQRLRPMRSPTPSDEDEELEAIHRRLDASSSSSYDDTETEAIGGDEDYRNYRRSLRVARELANRAPPKVPMEIDSPFDPAALGLKEIGNLASWTVSSCKPGCGVDALRDDDTGLFWQSDGPQPHHLNIHFSRLVSILSIRIFLDFEADESYTPTRITLLAGTGYHDLIPFAALNFEQPKGWLDVPLDHVGGGPDGKTLRAFLVQVRIVENHQNGKDTHVRGLKIYARDDRARAGIGGLLGDDTTGKKSMLKGQGNGMERSWLVEPDWMGEPELR